MLLLVYVFTSESICLYIHVSMYICVCKYIHIFFTWKYTYIYKEIFQYIYILIHTCLLIHLYIFFSLYFYDYLPVYHCTECICIHVSESSQLFICMYKF